MKDDGSDETTDDGAGATVSTDAVAAAIDEPPTATSDAGQTERNLLDESLRTFPWLRAGGVAALTLTVQYVLVTLVFEVGPSSVDYPTVWERLLQYGFVLYNAHHVPILVTATDAEVYGAAATNVLYAAENPSVPPLVFFLIPLVTLAIAGALFERRRGNDRAESLLEEAALVGTGIGLGYLLVGFAGRFVFVRRVTFETGTGQAAPAVLWLAILMFCIPLVFAGVGSVLGSVYAERVGSA